MTLKLILEEDGDVVEEATIVEAIGKEENMDVSVSDVKKSSIIWMRLTQTLIEKLCEEEENEDNNR